MTSLRMIRGAAATAVLLALLAPVARAAGYASAAANLQNRLPETFSKARLSTQDQLILETSDVFLSTSPLRQKERLGQACVAWIESLRAAGMAVDDALAVDGGEPAPDLRLGAARAGRADSREERDALL